MKAAAKYIFYTSVTVHNFVVCTVQYSVVCKVQHSAVCTVQVAVYLSSVFEKCH